MWWQRSQVYKSPFKTNADDPRLQTGDLIGITAGRFWAHNPQTRVNKLIAGDALPDGFVKGRLL